MSKKMAKEPGLCKYTSSRTDQLNRLSFRLHFLSLLLIPLFIFFPKTAREGGGAGFFLFFHPLFLFTGYPFIVTVLALGLPF